MTCDDLPDVLRVEHCSFNSPWSKQAFEAELATTEFVNPLVLEDEQGTFSGYAIYHHIIDEIHLVNIAVASEKRRKGYGDVLVRSVLALGRAVGAKFYTLEVRASNHAAQALYLKHSFRAVALRKNYYSDTGEDALVMIFKGTPDVEVDDILFSAELRKILKK